MITEADPGTVAVGGYWALGENIAYYRRAAGLTQYQLALSLQVTRQTVIRWEAGRHMPEQRHLQALVAVLGVPPDRLFVADSSS